MGTSPSRHAASENQQLFRWLRDSAEILIIAVVLYLIVSNLIFTVRVSGVSMEPGLQSDNLLVVSKFAYAIGSPQRGDIAIVKPPIPSADDFIKRIIGLPGDTIEIDGLTPPTRILIQPGGKGPWEVLEEPYLPSTPWDANDNCCTVNGTASLTPSPVTIPAGEYFVMGDNRNVSEDSRSFGFITRSNIIAKALFRLYPFSEIGSVGPVPTLVATSSPPSTSGLFALPWMLPLAPLPWKRSRRFRREPQDPDPGLPS